MEIRESRLDALNLMLTILADSYQNESDIMSKKKSKLKQVFFEIWGNF